MSDGSARPAAGEAPAATSDDVIHAVASAPPVGVRPEVTAMGGAAALPRRNGEVVFEAPWQGRAFGMALGVAERLGLDWSEFQQRLIAAIAARPEAPYFDCWLAALERLVLDQAVASPEELERARHTVREAKR